MFATYRINDYIDYLCIRFNKSMPWGSEM